MAEAAKVQNRGKRRSKGKNKTAQQPAQELVTLKGVVARKRFHNAENGYCVLVLEVDGEQEAVTAVGNLPAIREGDEYEFKGIWKEHAKYGRQFAFTAAELILPSTRAGVARYLSQVTYGVGIKKAERIVNALGDDALEQIKADVSVLDRDELAFLDERQRAEIVADLATNAVQAELASIICVPGSGIGMGTVSRIMAKYGADAVKTVTENPYLLSDDLFGVGFKKADAIGLAAGVKPDSPYRVEAAVDYVLKEAGGEGHVYLEPRQIVGKLLGMKGRFGKHQKGLLEGSGVQAVPDIRDANMRLITNGRCVRDGDAVYAKELYEAELIVAGCVRGLVSQKVAAVSDFELMELVQMITDIEARDGIVHAEQQRQAALTALTSPLSVITGGPGTGKTRTLLTICDVYAKLYPRNEIYLAAPTGRAAKRMSEATGREAKTIHRLLQYVPGEGFFYGADIQLPGPGLMIIDEASMIDIELASSLFAAVGDGLQVVLVGDVDQLPSVGAGSVLRDVIASEQVPTVRLEFNYRQAGGSKVAEYANLICQGTVPPLESVGDFEFVDVEDAEQARDVVLRLVQELVNEGRGLLDYQVLAPMRRGSCGVKELNEAIREIANPAVGTVGEGGKQLGGYRLGDKVMVIANSYGLGVFNGDIGLVTEIIGGKMAVDFGDQVVEFAVEHLELLTLSYASTIHKSQGSEYGTVIMPLVRQHYMMLQRNLVYTGITRAKGRLVLVADEWAVKHAVGNAVIEQRFSKLAERIRGEV